MRKRGRKAKCPYCQAGRTISKGVRRTVTMGNRPLRFCRECKRKFTVQRHGSESVSERAGSLSETPISGTPPTAADGVQ